MADSEPMVKQLVSVNISQVKVIISLSAGQMAQFQMFLVNICETQPESLEVLCNWCIRHGVDWFLTFTFDENSSLWKNIKMYYRYRKLDRRLDALSGRRKVVSEISQNS